MVSRYQVRDDVATIPVERGALFDAHSRLPEQLQGLV
jgi:hypothetical protein